MAVATAIGGAVAGRSAVAAAVGPDTMVVTVNQRAHRVSVDRRHDTVASVLRRNHLSARRGHLLGARSHMPLNGSMTAPTFLPDGQPVQADTAVGDADALRAEDGVDRAEATILRERPIPPPPEPAVMYQLWHPGAPGRAQSLVGVQSGEVVSTETVPPLPPAPVTEKVVALTFDDGPWPDTPQFVQVLHDAGVRATFCTIGRQVPASTDAVRQVAEAGMTLCNHTLNHNMYLDAANPAQVRAEVDGGRAALVAALGHAPAFYRPPGGTLSPEIIASAARDGEQVIHWSVDSMDNRKLSADALTRRVVGLVAPGAIVLMHDGGGDRSQTLAALPRIIALLREQGYGFATPDGVAPVQAPAAGDNGPGTLLR